MRKTLILGILFQSTLVMANTSTIKTDLTAFSPTVQGQIEIDNPSDKVLEKGPVGFPRNIPISAQDPINHINYSNILVGPSQKVAWYDITAMGYTHYRYITLYNSQRELDFRLSSFPAIQEECHDEGWRFAEWSQDVNFEVSLTSTIGYEYLGLSASVQASIKNGVNYRTSRSLRATLGVRAVHIPYGSVENWEGVTYIQWYDSNSGQYGFLARSIADNLGLSKYPTPFYLSNQNFIFKVKRENVEICPGYEKSLKKEELGTLFYTP